MSNILIVDDDVDFSEALLDSLSMLLSHYQFISCGESTQVFDLIYSLPVSLVITDMVMPDVEGIEIITRLKQDCPNIPIIAMSGGGRVGGSNYLILADALGTDAIFDKPLSVLDMSRKIEELLGSS
ncbi:Response regulator receiver domain protein [Shewanella psychrophila]|uniref:Response regulator receiver domain protein n=1 Tax=Shewanella psychrophila TaxID=225848 RepID=A0A1S6HKB3_9GAMM|nr:response regulator [Shewanella psychrophila]AQS35966.1 Response regulator receiver domain protein [Shewanella psychrophila]